MKKIFIIIFLFLGLSVFGQNVYNRERLYFRLTEGKLADLTFDEVNKRLFVNDISWFSIFYGFENTFYVYSVTLSGNNEIIPLENSYNNLIKIEINRNQVIITFYNNNEFYFYNNYPRIRDTETSQNNFIYLKNGSGIDLTQGNSRIVFQYSNDLITFSFFKTGNIINSINLRVNSNNTISILGTNGVYTEQQIIEQIQRDRNEARLKILNMVRELIN